MQVFGQECIQEGNGVFETLNKSSVYCASDPRCVGVLDHSCDNVGTFYVCLYGIRQSYFGRLDCVHKKSENDGENNLQLISEKNTIMSQKIYMFCYYSYVFNW